MLSPVPEGEGPGAPISCDVRRPRRAEAGPSTPLKNASLRMTLQCAVNSFSCSGEGCAIPPFARKKAKDGAPIFVVGEGQERQLGS